VNKRNLQ